jgi:hypothetical protein
MTIGRDHSLTTSVRLLVALTVGLFCAAGCGGVLSDAQVAAVNQFAEATKGFGTSPGTVITAYGDLRRQRGLLESATRTDARAAARDLTSALGQEAALETRAAAADAAMNVLDDYAEMLRLLSSAKFTEELQNETIALGGSIDNGIAAFNNKVAGAQVASFGDIVAGIVRGAGGIWIRREQHRALVAAVTRAETPVEKLTSSVEDMMAFFLGPPNEPDKNLFARESKEVQDLLARPRPDGRNFDVLDRTQQAMRQAFDGQKLAESCRKAAVQYRNAHKELVQAITEGRTDLMGLVAQIRVLAQEIKAGKRVRDEVKKARES